MRGVCFSGPDSGAPTWLSSPAVRPLLDRTFPSGPHLQDSLSLRFLWGERLIGEHFLRPGTSSRFTVGSAPDVDFVMGDARCVHRRGVRRARGHVALHVAHGGLHLGDGGQAMSLGDTVARRIARDEETGCSVTPW